MSAASRAVGEALAAPFAADEISWKPQAVKDNRCLAVAYIDARSVQDRLDEVVGTDGWSDEYTVLNDGSVVCKLSVRIDGNWVSKTDVGSLSEQPDGGDRLKAAFSDSLKRSAVKFGVGRYLYRLPKQWVDYDPRTRRIPNPPALPQWALPRGDVSALSRAVSDWHETLRACAEPGDLNSVLPGLSTAPADAKRPIWDMILEFAGERGWQFDPQTKTFGESNE